LRHWGWYVGFLNLNALFGIPQNGTFGNVDIEFMGDVDKI
jgi:hypothetical protein